MHNIQEKLLKLMDTQSVSGLSLREIASKIDETGSAQKIKHHLEQLAKKGFIKIDKKNNKIERIKSGFDVKSNLVSLPILGSANCGEAAFFADNHIEGYLKVTRTILGNLINEVKNLFVLCAVGSSMNRANVDGNTIDDGDYVIIDKSKAVPEDGYYMVSIIDDVANIKKVYIDNKNERVVLVSESNQVSPPIYIHRHDIGKYLIAGKVVKVMKKPDEFVDFRNTAIADINRALGPVSDREAEYYNNPQNFKKYA